MSTLIVYGLKRCSTCKKALDWLDEHALSYQFIDYRDQPIAPENLDKWADQLGGWPKLVNRASMTWRNLPEERKQPEADADWLALIAESPTLIRRPLVVKNGDALTSGFSDKKFATLV